MSARWRRRARRRSTRRATNTGGCSMSAMTRAAERLIVCGVEGVNKRPDGCWYELVARRAQAGIASRSRPTTATARCWRYRKSAGDAAAPATAADAEPRRRSRCRPGCAPHGHAERPRAALDHAVRSPTTRPAARFAGRGDARQGAARAARSCTG